MAAGNQPAPTGDPQQTYPMLPAFGHTAVSNGLPSGSGAAPDVSSAEPCASSGAFTVCPQALKRVTGIRHTDIVNI